MYPRLSRCPGNPNFIYAELVPDCPGIERTNFAPTKKAPRAAARGCVLQIALLLLDVRRARFGLDAHEPPLVVARGDSRPGVPGAVRGEAVQVDRSALSNNANQSTRFGAFGSDIEVT